MQILSRKTLVAIQAVALAYSAACATATATAPQHLKARKDNDVNVSMYSPSIDKSLETRRPGATEKLGGLSGKLTDFIATTKGPMKVVSFIIGAPLLLAVSLFSTVFYFAAALDKVKAVTDFKILGVEGTSPMMAAFIAVVFILPLVKLISMRAVLGAYLGVGLLSLSLHIGAVLRGIDMTFPVDAIAVKIFSVALLVLSFSYSASLMGLNQTLSSRKKSISKYIMGVMGAAAVFIAVFSVATRTSGLQIATYSDFVRSCILSLFALAFPLTMKYGQAVRKERSIEKSDTAISIASIVTSAAILMMILNISSLKLVDERRVLAALFVGVLLSLLSFVSCVFITNLEQKRMFNVTLMAAAFVALAVVVYLVLTGEVIVPSTGAGAGAGAGAGNPLPSPPTSIYGDPLIEDVKEFKTVEEAADKIKYLENRFSTYKTIIYKDMHLEDMNFNLEMAKLANTKEEMDKYVDQARYMLDTCEEGKKSAEELVSQAEMVRSYLEKTHPTKTDDIEAINKFVTRAKETITHLDSEISARKDAVTVAAPTFVEPSFFGRLYNGWFKICKVIWYQKDVVNRALPIPLKK